MNIFMGLGIVLGLFLISFLIVSFIFPDKIMDGASPDYRKEGVVVDIAADRIKIKSGRDDYQFNLSSVNLNYLIKIKKDKQEIPAHLSDIKEGNNVIIEGWQVKDEVVVSSIYLIQ